MDCIHYRCHRSCSHSQRKYIKGLLNAVFGDVKFSDCSFFAPVHDRGRILDSPPPESELKLWSWRWTTIGKSALNKTKIFLSAVMASIFAIPKEIT